MLLDPKNPDDLEEIKVALKIDTDDDDREVERSYSSAVYYVKGSIGRDKPSFYEQSDDIGELISLAVLQLADHYYKTRSATLETNTTTGSVREFDLGFTTIIIQLKAAYRSYQEGDSNGS